MSKKQLVLTAVVLSAVFIALVSVAPRAGSPRTLIKSAMILTSPSFENNGMIPAKFTCEGGNMNPELQIQNVPENARSLALIMHDPDAPMPGGFTHWVVWNIAPATTVIKEESTPPGASEGMNSGSAGYTGPCPPSGTHHYEFHLYALDTKLDLPPRAGKAELERAMRGHVIGETLFVGLYKKQGSSAGMAHRKR